MNVERAIEALEMENALMQFDPNTGEDYPIELQNQDNQDLYNANLIAISALEKQLNGGWIPVSQMLTKRNKDGYAVPIDCRLEKCRYRHCNDCAYVGTDNIFKIIERLCKYEETGLVFEIMDKED